MKRCRLFVSVILLMAIGIGMFVSVIVWLAIEMRGCWFAPSQHEVSPNGRYDARATFNYDGSRRWLELKVTMLASGKTIWKKDLGNRADDHPPFDQGLGHLDLIQWADDSSEVRFASRSHDVSEVVEWLIVKFDNQGKVISTTKVPGSRFPSYQKWWKG